MHFGIAGSGPRGASLTGSEKEIFQICYLQKFEHKFFQEKSTHLNIPDTGFEGPERDSHLSTLKASCPC